MDRRQFLCVVPAAASCAVAACAHSTGRAPDAVIAFDSHADAAALVTLADRLPAAGVLLLGEVHDNAQGHAARLHVLRRLAVGAVPTVLALEHIDQSQQGALDAARAAAPRDVSRWIDVLRSAGNTPQWPWELLRPALALAADAEWSVRGANLARTELAAKGAAARDANAPASALGDLGLERLRAAIADGHCGVLPPTAVDRLMQLQQVRDRAIVDTLLKARTAAPRVILLAGNGHVRRDFGVGAYPALHASANVVSVGFLERGDRGPADAFDHVVEVAPQSRADPCIGMRERKQN